jgi:uncharacterized protein
MKRTLVAIALALCLVLPLPAAAGEEGSLARATAVVALKFYEDGEYAKALSWWRMLAEHEDALSQYGLGLMHHNGEGVPQDYQQAISWYRKAAEQGFAEAQNNLGTMFVKGEGVPQDYVEAHRWYNLAAARGSEIGRKNRDNLATKMAPSQIEKAQDLAREWLAAHPN